MTTSPFSTTREAQRLRERLRSQRDQRGAAILIVTLVITLLSALGLFAVRSASLMNQAAGYDRQMTQTHYVADYAVNALIATMLTQAVNHANLMQGVGVNNRDTGCVAYANQIDPTCAMYSYDWLEGQVQIDNAAQTLVLPTVGKVHGSFGPGLLEADMKIEVTDLHSAWPPLPGMQADCSGQGGVTEQHVMVTVSAEGMVRPTQAQAGAWDTASATAAGVEQVRAHVIMGPVPYDCSK